MDYNIQDRIDLVNTALLDRYAYQLANQDRLGFIPNHPKLLTLDDLNPDDPVEQVEKLISFFKFFGYCK